MQPLLINDNSLKSLFKKLGTEFVILNDKSDILFISDNALTLFNIKKETHVGNNWANLFKFKEQHYKKVFSCLIEQATDYSEKFSAAEYEFDLNSFKGKTTLQISRVENVDEYKRLVAVSINNYSQSIGQSVDLLSHEVINNTNDAIVITEYISSKISDQVIIYLNKSFSNLTQFATAELIGKQLKTIFRESQKNEKVISKLLKSKSSSDTIDFINNNGKSYNLEISLHSIEIDGSNTKHNVWEFKDITNIRLLEDKLGFSNHRNDAVNNYLNDCIVITDQNKKISYINKSTEKVCKIKFDKVKNKNFEKIFKFLDPVKSKPINNPITNVFNKTGNAAQKAKAILKVGKDLKTLIIYRAMLLRDNYGKIKNGIFTFSDLSEKHQYEEKFNKLQRHETMSAIIRGISHDFNNFLTGIYGTLSLARENVDPKDKVLTILETAENSTKLAKNLTRQLLSFSKGLAPTKSKTTITNLLRDSVNFMMCGSECCTNIYIPEKLWPIEVDEGQLSQVLINLLINADQAMPDGGSISLTANNLEIIGDENIPLPKGSYVIIKIMDEGVGISKNNLLKIFNQNFTTKDKGSGIGLHSSYSIIKSHNGHIQVESTVGKGTEFSVYLPALPNEIIMDAIEDSSDSEDTTLYHGKGRVLVMDDEPMVQQITGEILMHLGYDYKIAKHGEEAYEFYKQAINTSDAFIVTLMDLTIVGGQGALKTIEDILKLDPNAKVILTTGYANDQVLKNYKNYGFTSKILKPFNMQQLSMTLKNAIDSD